MIALFDCTFSSFETNPAFYLFLCGVHVFGFTSYLFFRMIQCTLPEPPASSIITKPLMISCFPKKKPYDSQNTREFEIGFSNLFNVKCCLFSIYYLQYPPLISTIFFSACSRQSLLAHISKKNLH